ncbi:probable ribose-5-phosphate isomerase 4, chloroplastic [Euphorbia lathyris]|uniref:probable ribose-5-phosphate isomerase 4, chloroplastic n=1 Tax=Euphorbia lathyris TaxID=212925 RepID=UPI0033135DFD
MATLTSEFVNSTSLTNFKPASISISSSSSGRPTRISFPLTRVKALAQTSASLDTARHTVDTYIKSGMVIGLGCGQASGMAIQYLGGQLRAGVLKDIIGIPMSIESANAAAKAGIPLDQYKDGSQIDFAFHDADVVEEETLLAVVGRQKLLGVESIIQEKSILNTANKLVFMITDKEYKSNLDGSIPVLVHSFNWMESAEKIDDLFIGDAEVWRRSSMGQASPTGGDFPLMTKEGYNVLDIIFTSPITRLAEVAEILDKIDGVVDHGIVSKFPCTTVIASDDGIRIVNIPPTVAEAEGAVL